MEASIGQAVAVNAENVFAFCEENSNLSEIGASLNRRFSEPIRVSWPDAADILCHFATTGKSYFMVTEVLIIGLQRVTGLTAARLTEVGLSKI